MSAMLDRLRENRVLPDVDYILNHLVNRIPIAGARIRAYAALGVSFDEIATANICLGVEMWAAAGLTVGRGSTIGQRCYIDARGGVQLEEQVSISREAMVLTATHDPDSPDFAATLAPVRFGSRSWVASRAIIMPGVSVGEGAVVAAGALVTSDVPPFTIVGGVPARKLRDRPGPLSYEIGWRPNWH
jgi:acetyltransferase-like isoleucine patch superfamily enzyme